jgi:hypothetical protein
MRIIASMIDPRKVTDFNRSPSELEEFMLFSVVVAGKNAFTQAQKLNDFLNIFNGYTPFGAIRTMDMDGSLDHFLRSVKMGQYERIGTAFRGLARYFRYDDDTMRYHPLHDVPIKYLEVFKGIGMKTARFFAMHTRPHQRFACLDTHILKWLGEKGHEVPKMTPRGEKYLTLEQIYLGYCDEMQKSPEALDLEIWNSKHEVKVGKDFLIPA